MIYVNKIARTAVCNLIGHQYRNSIPQIFECVVYCLRCDRKFGHFDSPAARLMWTRLSQQERSALIIEAQALKK